MRRGAVRIRAFFGRARDLWRLLWAGEIGKVWWAIAYRAYSDSTSIGLRRDLAVSFAGPSAKIPFRVRPLTPGDDLSILNPSPGLSADEAYWRLGQLRLLATGLRTCYVAIAPDGNVCYMQWLIPASDNGALQTHFGNLYPALQSDEALLEGAYTPEAYRGQGIMSAAMARIAQQASESGARWVITFVDERNEASLRGCLRAGFMPYNRRRERFRLFHRRVVFEEA